MEKSELHTSHGKSLKRLNYINHMEKVQKSELHKSHGNSLKSLNYTNHMEAVSKV